MPMLATLGKARKLLRIGSDRWRKVPVDILDLTFQRIFGLHVAIPLGLLFLVYVLPGCQKRMILKLPQLI